MKKLCIDIGNSRVKFGVFDNDDFIYANSFSREEFSCQKIENILEEQNLNIDKIIICSVIPSLTQNLKFNIQNKEIKPVIITNDYDFGFKSEYDLSQIGIDRLTAVYGVKHSINKDNFILIDCGTAVTIDVFLNNELKGGIIYPGINLMLDALSKNTEQLPKIELKKEIDVLGRNTEDAISSGVFYGFVNLVEFYIKLLKNVNSNIFVFGTGGACSLIKDKCRFDMIDEDIILKGLNKMDVDV